MHGTHRESRGGCAAPAFCFLECMIIVILSEARAKDPVAITLSSLLSYFPTFSLALFLVKLKGCHPNQLPTSDFALRSSITYMPYKPLNVLYG